MATSSTTRLSASIATAAPSRITASCGCPMPIEKSYFATGERLYAVRAERMEGRDPGLLRRRVSRSGARLRGARGAAGRRADRAQEGMGLRRPEHDPDARVRERPVSSPMRTTAARKATFEYLGESCFAGPKGSVVAAGATETLRDGELDPADIKSARQTLTYLDDCKMLSASSTVTALALPSAGTGDLKAGLKASTRARKAKALALVAPLLIFVALVFVGPIGLLLQRSVAVPDTGAALPNTAQALAAWDGHRLPPERRVAALVLGPQGGAGGGHRQQARLGAQPGHQRRAQPDPQDGARGRALRAPFRHSLDDTSMNAGRIPTSGER